MLGSLRSSCFSLAFLIALGGCASGASTDDGSDPGGDTVEPSAGGSGGDGAGGFSTGLGGAHGGGAQAGSAQGGTAQAGGAHGGGAQGGSSAAGFPGSSGSSGAGKGGSSGAPSGGAGGMHGAGAGGAANGCGDGTKQPSEQCDGSDFGGATCASVLSNPNVGGILHCTASCTIDTTGCKANPVCGDGVIDQASEECDGSDFGSKSCASVTGNSSSTGSLTCTAQCTVSTASCKMGAYCGDGVKNAANEQCDGYDLAMATCASVTGNPQEMGQLLCNASCQFDTSKCALNPVCGDGVKNTTMEQCDGTDLNGATCQSLLGNTHATGTVTCTSACAYDISNCSVPPYCGDAIKNGNEDCDGNDFGGATCASVLGPGHQGSLACSSTCQIGTGQCTSVPYCGNNQVDQASEQCDGPDVAGGTCAALVGPGSTGSVACYANCTFNTQGCSPPVLCGNGVIDGGEQCDGASLGGASCASVTGNVHEIGSLGCTSSCTFDASGCVVGPYCGDGYLDAGEECDAGPSNGSSRCSSNCTTQCYGNELQYGTHCYEEVQIEYSWNDAETDCEAFGGHLVTMSDSNENQFVWDNMSFSYTKSRWIGLDDIVSEGNFVWVDGEPVGYLDWNSGEPNNSGGNEDCVEFYFSSDAWNDVTCSNTRWYWCEYEPPVLYPLSRFLMSKDRTFAGSTDAVHAGEPDRRTHHTLAPSIAQTATYTFDSTEDLARYMRGEADAGREEYGRYGNPTVSEVEERIAALEKADDALLFASGMAAVSTTMLALLKSGDHVVLFQDCYRRTRQLVTGTLARLGIGSTLVPPADLAALAEAIRPETKLVVSESPTNPYLVCVDLGELVRVTKAKSRAKVLVDATFATPVNARPIEHGVDLVVHSATKYLAGHNDVLAGALAGSAPLVSLVRDLRGVLGGVCDPHAAFLVGRGMKTLALRVERQNATALAIARALSAHPKVAQTFYPLLETHASYAVAREQMAGGGGVVSFVVKGGRAAAARFVDACTIPKIAPSLGGVESLVEQPCLMSFSELDDEALAKVGIDPALVRLAVGVEDTDDLVRDVLGALDAV